MKPRLPLRLGAQVVDGVVLLSLFEDFFHVLNRAKARREDHPIGKQADKWIQQTKNITVLGTVIVEILGRTL